MYSFAILFLLSFFGTYYAMPHSIRKLKENGYLVKDMYKFNKPLIPTNAGIIILFTSFISISLLPLLIRIMNRLSFSNENITDLSETNLAFLLVISIYAMYGLVDDLVDIGRKLKLVLPICFGYPLLSVINPVNLWIPIIGDFDLTSYAFDNVTWSDIFRITVIPIYVMVVANLVNMHSGYNGLQSGTSIIILFFLVIKSWYDGMLVAILPAGAFLGSMVALWFFNKFPAKVFEGNVGSLLFGSVIGTIIVVQEYWWFGFFILIPHTINFFLWIFWLYLMRIYPEKYLNSDNEHQKFGSVTEDGKINAPNFLTLKWFPAYFFKADEYYSVIMMYFVTLSFCAIGFVMFTI